MATPDHDGTEDQFAEDMPGAREGIRGPGHTSGDADAAVGGDGLEDDVEGAEDDGVAFELAGLGDGDEEDREGDPPEVVGELATELLADEVAAALFGAVGLAGRGGEGAFQGAEDGGGFGGGGFALGVEGTVGWGGVFRVDAEGAFFVDVRVADGEGDGEGGDVHHQDVQSEETGTEA